MPGLTDYTVRMLPNYMRTFVPLATGNMGHMDLAESACAANNNEEFSFEVVIQAGCACSRLDHDLESLRIPGRLRYRLTH